MLEHFRQRALRFLRVPAEPHPPEGGRVIRVFRAAPAYYRYRLALWGLKQLSALLGLIGGLVFIATVLDEVTEPRVVWVVGAIEVGAWALFLLQLPVGLAVVRLDFEMRWYILSDRSLRIREGILEVREKTMTFANIQQVSIRQNPLQRMLGLADVEVRTAGGGAGGKGKEGQVGESMHEAYFRGVDNAAEIRTAILERVRRHRDAGLGDPDEPALPPDVPEPEALLAARELLREARELRRALAPIPRG